MSATDNSNFTVKEILQQFRDESNLRFDGLEHKIDQRNADFETRLRYLERFRYSFPSLAVIAVIIAVVSAAATLYGVL